MSSVSDAELAPATAAEPGRRGDRPAGITDNLVGRLLLQAVLPLALIALWWVTSADSDSLYYPPLSEVVEALDEDWLFEQVSTDLLPSLGRFAAGYALAGGIGIAAGVALGLTPWLRHGSQAVTEFLRALPPPLLLPFALVTFGTTNTAKVFVIALGSVWPVLLNTVDGVRGVDHEKLEMARSFRLSPPQRVAWVMLPAASPRIVAGLRIALSVALILMVISEMQGSSNGLGYQVLSAQRSFDTAGMFAGIVVIGLVGVILNTVFLAVEHRALRWHQGV
jgi:ABC-type nitrate/sulfonate/bicarbonate transport system permease component